MDEVTLSPLVGVLALQGAFAAHERALSGLGVVTRQVRTPADLIGIDGLVLPGGESTTMSRLLDTAGLRAPLSDMLAEGLPALGTCAGMILLAVYVLDGQPEQRSLDRVDIAVRRNGYGRQVDSFETDIDVVGLEAPFHAVFIRAPRVERHGAGVDVLASCDGVPVLLRQGSVLVASFHPELTDDLRVHGLFVDIVRAHLVTPANAS